MARSSGTTPSLPPPFPAAKRRNAVLRLYDAPLYRDWIFWPTVGLVAIVVVPLPQSAPPRASVNPTWLNVPISLTLVVLAAIVLGWVRLLIRRWWWRKSQRKGNLLTSVAVTSKVYFELVFRDHSSWP